MKMQVVFQKVEDHEGDQQIEGGMGVEFLGFGQNVQKADAEQNPRRVGDQVVGIAPAPLLLEEDQCHAEQRGQGGQDGKEDHTGPVVCHHFKFSRGKGGHYSQYRTVRQGRKPLSLVGRHTRRLFP